MSTHDLSIPQLSIIIPAYNEASRISATLEIIGSYLNRQNISAEVLVVLNNCTDKTDTVVLECAKKDSRIRMIDLGRVSELGNTKGIAVARGMTSARGELALMVDADISVPIDDYDNLLVAIKSGADIAIGSREVTNAHIEKSQVWYRIVLGRLGNFLIRFLLLPDIYDTQCGFKLFTQKAAQSIFSKTTTHGWGFDIEALAIGRKLGYQISEIGVRWHDVAGSKVHAGAYFDTLGELFTIWWRMITKKGF